MYPTVSAGQMRERVRFERRIKVANGRGTFRSIFKAMGNLRGVHARISPVRGGEQMVAQRVAGQGLWDIWVRSTPETRAITTGDRIVDENDPTRIFNIKWVANLDERNRFLVFTCETGVNEG